MSIKINLSFRRQTGKKKPPASSAQILVNPASWEAVKFQIPIKIFIVLPVPAPYFGPFLNPENTLPDPLGSGENAHCAV